MSTATHPRLASSSEVRSWAEKKGYEVGSRGRLPREVIDHYNRSHKVRRYVEPRLQQESKDR